LAWATIWSAFFLALDWLLGVLLGLAPGHGRPARWQPGGPLLGRGARLRSVTSFCRRPRGGQPLGLLALGFLAAGGGWISNSASACARWASLSSRMRCAWLRISSACRLRW
jgi:hypothetical protein